MGTIDSNPNIPPEILAVQGIGWLVPDFEKIWADADQRETLLDLVRILEKDPVALGTSPHLMAVAYKQKR